MRDVDPQTGVSSLVAEYTALHAEEKHISARLEEIKKLLQTFAAAGETESATLTIVPARQSWTKQPAATQDHRDAKNSRPAFTAKAAERILGG